ncbi:MAG TPA: DinB family protein [Gemmatimonadaceae bacterium]|jgi:uncharacterized damage-inducible protein DinB|nr:DinB family protein [Gemmatimonadaceae bacterium]
MKELLLSLVDHMRWADAIVGESLQRNPPPDPEAARLFAHIASAEHLWYARIEGRPAEHAVWPTAMTPSEAAALAAEHADLYQRLVEGASAEQLARRIPYRNSAGRDFLSRVSDVVTHVAMHGSYHRGQIARQLRSGGLEPPYTDFIQYTRRDQ